MKDEYNRTAEGGYKSRDERYDIVIIILSGYIYPIHCPTTNNTKGTSHIQKANK